MDILHMDSTKWIKEKNQEYILPINKTINAFNML